MIAVRIPPARPGKKAASIGEIAQDTKKTRIVTPVTTVSICSRDRHSRAQQNSRPSTPSHLWPRSREPPRSRDLDLDLDLERLRAAARLRARSISRSRSFSRSLCLSASRILSRFSFSYARGGKGDGGEKRGKGGECGVQKMARPNTIVAKQR